MLNCILLPPLHPCVLLRGILVCNLRTWPCCRSPKAPLPGISKMGDASGISSAPSSAENREQKSVIKPCNGHVKMWSGVFLQTECHHTAERQLSSQEALEPCTSRMVGISQLLISWHPKSEVCREALQRGGQHLLSCMFATPSILRFPFKMAQRCAPAG